MVLRRPALVLGEQLVQHQQQRGGIERRVALALEVQQHDDQQRHHQDVVPALLDRRPGARQLAPRQALEAVAGGVGVDLHEEGEVVERGRDDGGQRHLGVADVEELGDDEGGGAHHRRRQHGAGRGAGLDGAGVGGREARALHGGDGHGAGGQHVGDDAARHHAEQAAGEDADLGRAAAERAAQREGEIDEELAGPRHHQGGAEHQEADHGLGERLDRDAEQALAGEHVVGGRLLQRRLAAPERPEPARLRKQRIDGEGQHAQQQAPAAGAAQRLHQQHPHDEAGDDHRQGRAAELPAELGRLAHVEHQVEARRRWSRGTAPRRTRAPCRAAPLVLPGKIRNVKGSMHRIRR